MRLIDADALLEEINTFSMRITGSANAMAITVMAETKKSIANIVSEQPTAYDVDRVVEQLEERRNNAVRNISLNSQSEDLYGEIEYTQNHYNSIIEIVKAGGADE